MPRRLAFRSILPFCVLAATVWLASSATSLLKAQITSATISGTVRDESGAIIPGVSIAVKHLETALGRNAVSDDAGRYRVPLLDPGTYEVQAELAGFQTAVRTGIKPEVGSCKQTLISLAPVGLSRRQVWRATCAKTASNESSSAPRSRAALNCCGLLGSQPDRMAYGMSFESRESASLLKEA